MDAMKQIASAGGGGKGPGFKKMQKNYVKGQFAKMVGGDLVSDVEKRAMEKQRQESIDQGIAASQRLITRSQMSHTGGSPIVAGAMHGAARQMGAAGADAAVTATGQDKRLQAALRDKRAGEALAAGERLIARRQENAKDYVDFGLRSVEAGSEIMSL